MRRAIFAATVLAALLALPGPACAQANPASGQVTFDNAVIGAESCPSTATGSNTSRQVSIAWADQIDPAATGNNLTSGVFRIYATNTNPTAATGSTARYCATTNNPNNQGGPIFAAQVGSDLANSASSLSGSGTVNTAAIAAAAGGCELANGAAVYVCVQFYPYQANAQTTPQATPTAWAVGQMTISTSRPGSVVLNSVLPGNQALSGSWSANSSAPAAKYKLFAVSLADPLTVPSSGVFNSPSTFGGFNPLDPRPHDSGFVTATGPYAVRGLVNGVTYGVAVVAYTDAETASDPSNVLTGIPELTTDFWSTYKADGGRETGGCSSGVAGPVGLLILAGSLALVRRRK